MSNKFTRSRKSSSPITDSRRPFCYVTKSGKTFRETLLDGYVLKEKQTEVSQQIRSDRFAESYSDMGLIQPLYNPEQLAYTPELNTYHARCCRVKAMDTAGLGWDLIPKGDKPDERVKEEIENFFNEQAPPLIATLYQHQYDVEVIGHGGLEIVRAGYSPQGQPVLLTHVPGHTLRIHQDDNKFAQRRGTKTRWFKRIGYEMDVDKDSGAEYALGSLTPESRASELIWNTIYSQRSDYYGIPDLIPALGAVYGDIARRNFNISFFDNFGVPAYAVFITGDFDPGEPDPKTGRTELEESIEEHFEELSKQPHSTLVITVPSREGSARDVKIEFEPLSVDVKEVSFRLYRKDNRDEIISAHGVPPYRLGIAETGSLGGSTAEESTEIYKNSIINPRQELLEVLINQHIIWSETGFNTKDWAFKFREIDTKDEEHDMSMAEKLFDMAALRPIDIIRYFGARFGVNAQDINEKDEPELFKRYLRGTPINEQGQEAEAEEESDQKAEAIMKSLQEKLLRVAVKHADRDAIGNGGRNRAALALVKGREGLGAVD